MMNYVTRGQSNPIGKQRLYYAASKKDFSYLHDVSKHILHDVDVAIYYDDQNKTENTIEQEICGMDLVVLVLTNEALDSMCDAISRVLFIAYKNKIPVLPLAIEDGVGGKFSDFCLLNRMEKMHVLYPNKQEIQALSFSQKLEDYFQEHLQGKLLENAERERIYQNFSGSAFLSYRKADRKVAVDLIKLIHQKEECRDFAIWYDEYLTAGESYDEEIKSYIDFCQVFLFLVTNNMLKEDNYAIREEYKRAKELNKNIIIVDMIAENHTLPAYLMEGNRYIGLQDISTLPLVMGEYIKKKTFFNEEEKYKHDYYLGLAYVYGIGVEKEKEYGLRLIKSVAEWGLPEAMDTIIRLYMEDLDIRMVIYWQEHLKDYYGHRFSEKYSLDTLKTYIGHLLRLSHYYRDASDLNSVVVCLDEIRCLLEENDGWENDTEMLEKAIIWCDCYSDIYYIVRASSNHFSEENLEKERLCYIMEHRYALMYADMVDSFKAKRYIYTPIMRMAEIMSFYGATLDERIGEYLKALELIQDADNKYPCYESRTDLFGCYQSLAKLYREKNAELAMSYALNMLEYARQTWLERQELIRCFKYAEALEFIANLQIECGEITEAVRNLNKATQARVHCIESRERMGVGEKNSVYALCCDYFSLIDLHHSLGNHEKALPLLEAVQNHIFYYYLENKDEENTEEASELLSRLFLARSKLGID